MSVVLVVLGLYIVITGQRRSGAHPSCGACAGDLSGTLGSSPSCPGCGAALATTGIVPPGHRGQPRAGLLGLLAAGAGLCDWIIGVCLAWAAAC